MLQNEHGTDSSSACATVCSSGSEAGDHCRAADIQTHVLEELSHPVRHEGDEDTRLYFVGLSMSVHQGFYHLFGSACTARPSFLV